MSRFTFDQINDATGFANGDAFADEDAVRGYFTQENICEMGFDAIPQSTLDYYADAVISNGWHMGAIRMLSIS